MPHALSTPGALPFVLNSPDLSSIGRAIVVVKGWHTETFSSGVLTRAPEIFRFVEPRVFQQAVRAFGKDGAPLQELFGFERVFVAAGQTVTVYLGAQGAAFTQVGADGMRRAVRGVYRVRFGLRGAASASGFAEFAVAGI